jgi:hypothetical protein
MKDMKAETVAQLYVEHIILGMPGAPQQLLTDQGAQLNLAEVFQEVNKIMKVKGKTTTAYHPAANGKVERFNRTLKEKITMLASTNQKEWDTYLPSVLAAYRATPQARTKETPNFLCFGRDPYFIIDRELETEERVAGDQEEYKGHLMEVMERASRLARDSTTTMVEKQKKHYDKNRSPVTLKKGDLVMLEINRQERQGQNKKFIMKWKGPYRVTEKEGELTFHIQGVVNPRDRQKVHVE